jgi:hypothetical protein
MPYRMDEERQQRVIAAFNAGRKPRAVANEVGASEAAIKSTTLLSATPYFPPACIRKLVI